MFTPFYFEKEFTHKLSGIRYRVEIGDFFLRDEQGKPEASIYSYAYINQAEDASRPVIFAYNGGPGASSSWVHLGLLGPKTVTFTGYPAHPEENTFAENPYFLLDSCDIVLINPPGTYQTEITDAARQKYFCPSGDAQAVSQFVQDWLRRHGRLHAPVYLLGESYGTLRSVYVADVLPAEIDLRGIISIGTSFNVGTQKVLPVEPNVRRLGASAAACWYHYHREECERETFVKDAMDFAYGDYAHALLMGNRLERDVYEQVLEKLHYYTGLDKALLRAQKLRFSEIDFLTKLCPGRLVSAYDSRTSRALETASMTEEEWNLAIRTEPFMAIADPTIESALQRYTREELAEPAEERPRIDFLDIAMSWDFACVTADPMDLPEKLMKQRENLRFLFVSGYYDLQSTFDFVTYYRSQYDLPAERVTENIYDAGHAAYVGGSAAAALCGDIRTFVTAK